MLLGIVAVSLALRLLTWNDVADGPWPRYVKVAIFGAFAAATVWLLVRVQTGPRSLVPLLAAVAVLLCGDVIHYVRLANPMSRGGAVLSFTAAFGGELATRRQWDFETAGAGKVLFEPGAFRLESPPNSTAFAIARVGPRPDVRTNWWLPVGLADREQSERLTWRATVARTGDYYVIAELQPLLVQIVAYGVHVTYPDERGTGQGYELQHPVGADGKPHDWELHRDARQITLRIDGQQVWTAPQRGSLNQLKLGETKRDPLHAGTLRVEAATYVSTLASSSPPS
jgi:hypothetical protein